MKTEVKFLKEQNSDEIFAFFPCQKTVNFCTSYAHIGQHSDCHIDYANGCEEANYNQYQDLLAELITIGYKDLVILNSQKIEYWRSPMDYEVKFGHGAIHYREFTLAEIGLNKKGEIKNRFKANDNLIYKRK